MRRPVISLLLLLAGCQRTVVAEPAPEPPAQAHAAPAAAPGAGTTAGDPAPIGRGEAHAHDEVEALPPCKPGPGTLLARAVGHYDNSKFEDALACAVQAAAAEPGSAAAHSERAAAMVALGRHEDARVAYARALAIDAHHADALLGAADLYLNRLRSSRDFSELALAYANSGHAAARRDKDRRLAGQFAVLAANALNNLGRGREAVRRAEEALSAGVEESSARYEKAAALWELCRFDEAEREFRRLLADPGRAAVARYHLGLIAERRGRAEEAQREFDTARELAPEDFPRPVEVSAEEFARLVAEAVRAQPPAVQRELEQVDVSTQDLPDLEDLIASEPPLSPEIIGLFRGPSLGEPCPSPSEVPGPCRSIVIYRRNLARVVRDRAELEAQVRVTLTHEIGHLHGEDDVELAARGLE